MSYLWNSRETLYPKLKNLRFGPFNFQLSLHMKTPRKHVFHTKTTWKTLKNMGYTNHFQKQTKRAKIFLGLINKYLSIHITFEHIQSHKWDKHSLNQSLVCCGWVSSVKNSLDQSEASMIDSIKSYTTDTRSSGLSQL